MQLTLENQAEAGGSLSLSSDTTYELYTIYLLRNNTRQSRFGLPLPAYFTGGFAGSVFNPHNLSSDMLRDLDLHAPDLHYGHIMEGRAWGMGSSGRTILRFLHIHAAFMGFARVEVGLR